MSPTHAVSQRIHRVDQFGFDTPWYGAGKAGESGNIDLPVLLRIDLWIGQHAAILQQVRMLEANLELVEQRRLDGRVEIYHGQPGVVLVIPGHWEGGKDGRRTGVILVLVLNHDAEVIARVDVV